MTEQEILEALLELRNVFPNNDKFKELVAEGARGDEVHTITGDDLAGACHSLNLLMKHFGLPEGYLDGYRKVYGL